MSPNIQQRLVWVYVTNIETQTRIDVAAKVLNVESAVIKWNVDTEDCDNVLKVETSSLKEGYIPSLLAKYDLACVPMAD